MRKCRDCNLETHSLYCPTCKIQTDDIACEIFNPLNSFSIYPVILDSILTPDPDFGSSGGGFDGFGGGESGGGGADGGF